MQTTKLIFSDDLLPEIFYYTIAFLPLEKMIECRRVCLAWKAQIDAYIRSILIKNRFSVATVNLLEKKPIHLRFFLLTILEKKNLELQKFKLTATKFDIEWEEIKIQNFVSIVDTNLPLPEKERLNRNFSNIPEVKKYIDRGYRNHGEGIQFNYNVASDIGVILWPFVDQEDFLIHSRDKKYSAHMGQNRLFTPTGALALLSSFSTKDVVNTHPELLSCLLSVNGKLALAKNYFSIIQAQKFYNIETSSHHIKKLKYKLFFLDSTLKLFEDNIISFKELDPKKSHYIQNVEFLLTAQCKETTYYTREPKFCNNAGGVTLLRSKAVNGKKIISKDDLEYTDPAFAETLLSHPYAIVALKYKLISFYDKAPGNLGKGFGIGNLFDKRAIYQHIDDKLEKMIDDYKKVPAINKAAVRIQKSWRNSIKRSQSKIEEELGSILSSGKGQFLFQSLNELNTAKELSVEGKVFDAKKQLNKIKRKFKAA